MKIQGKDWNIENLFLKVQVQIHTQNGHVDLTDGNFRLNSFLIFLNYPELNRITNLEGTAERASWVGMKSQFQARLRF